MKYHQANLSERKNELEALISFMLHKISKRCYLGRSYCNGLLRQHRKVYSLKLPKIELRKFGGDIKD